MGMSLIEERGMDIKVDQETPETRWGEGAEKERHSNVIFSEKQRKYIGRYSREKHL